MILVDLQYFPPVSFFYASFSESYVAFDEYDAYRKMSFRNRCLIAGANNIIGLSVPIVGGRQQRAFMKDVRVSQSEAWPTQHWRSLHSAYNRSPYFDHYAGELEEIFDLRPVWLQDWNRLCLDWVRAKIGWQPELIWGREKRNLLSPEKEGGGWRDERNRLLPKNYLTHPCPRYHQVFEETRGFQANLSVLDLLFNTGPGAGEYLSGRAGISKARE